MTPLTVGSLFSGIGGLDLGLERAGMSVVWQSEIDPYCCRVLAKHWPDVPNLGDVTRIDWTEVPRVDVICGGYPCQPFSVAGRRQGEHDPRHLWPWMLDAIRVLRPRWALLENVAGHLALGFGRVLGDLAEIGYDTEWDCIPAVAVGALHRRDRVFVIAYPSSDRLPHIRGTGQRERQREEMGWHQLAVRHGTDGSVADTDVDGLQGQQGSPAGRHEVHAHLGPDADRRRADVADTDSPPGRIPRSAGKAIFGSAPIERLGRCGCSQRHTWPAEPDVGRVAHGVPHRVDRLRALGNAVVPQVAEHIGRLIIEAVA